VDGTLIQEESSAAAGQSANGIFDTEYLKTDLKGRSIRSGAATMSGQAAKFVIRVASMVVLARLLTPEEYGLVGMVVPLTEFVLMFRDMGLSAATIQKAQISHAQVSTLFWINVGIGVVLAMITAALAPVIAWYYGEPELIPITLVSAIGFILGGLAIQHESLLKRQMRFGAVAVIEVASVSVGIVTAIVSALLGAGYWALVLWNLAISVTATIGVWTASGWRPGWPSLRCGVRSMLDFGRDVIGFRVVNYFARQSDKILLGRFHGKFVLGLYGRAHNLLTSPLSQITWPITTVAMPVLSRIQDDRRRYASYYTRLVQLLSFVTMPMVVFLAVCSKSVISLMLGAQWAGASRIFQILAAAAFIQPLSATAGIVLLSLGRTARLFKYGIFHSVAVVLGFAIGVRWGAVGVAAGYTVAEYAVLFPALWYCLRGTPVTVGTVARAIGRPVAASLAAVLAIMPVQGYLSGLPDIAIVGLCFVIASAAYLVVWIAIPGGIQVLRDFGGYVTLVFPKKGSEGSNERRTL